MKLYFVKYWSPELGAWLLSGFADSRGYTDFDRALAACKRSESAQGSDNVYQVVEGYETQPLPPPSLPTLYG
jgi:hypothetical protein